MAKVLQYQALVEPVFIPPVSPTVTWGWFEQASEPQRLLKPRIAEYYIEPLSPNSFVKQKLDWLIQTSEPLALRIPKTSEQYVEPLVPIAGQQTTSMGWYVQQPGPSNYQRLKTQEQYVEPIVSISGPSNRIDWFVGQLSVLSPGKPKTEQFYVEPLAPNSFIKQNLGWLVEQPFPTAQFYGKRMGESFAVEPLAPIIMPTVTLTRYNVLSFQCALPGALTLQSSMSGSVSFQS